MVHELISSRPEDLDAFLEDIGSRDNVDDRLVALTAAFSLWRAAGRPRQVRQRMWGAVKGEPELERKLHALLHPGPMSDEVGRWRRQERDYESRDAKRRQQEEQARTDLARRLTDRANGIRTLDEHSKDQYFPDIFCLARKIAELGKSSSKWGCDRWDLLEIDLSREVAEAARDGLMRFWRLYNPQLPSESDGDGRTNGVLAGLAGLAIEARERPDWAHQLSRRGRHRRPLCHA